MGGIKGGQSGLKTICIDKRGTFGGTCLNEGCIPSKCLLNASHELHKAQHLLPKLGVITSGVSYDFAEMMKHKEQTVSSLCKGIEYLFKKNKIEYLKGEAKFISPHRLEVTPKKTGEAKSIIEAKHIVIATGSEVSEIPGKPLAIDEETIISSRGALSLRAPPKNMVVVGAGVIGLELGSVYARLGTKVTVVEYMPKILPPMDDELCSALQKLLKRQGFKFLLSHKLVSGEHLAGGGVNLRVEDMNKGEIIEISTEIVLAATGRIPFTEGLDLKNAGLEVDETGRLQVNSLLQTAVPHIYAIGDVIPGQMLAHRAEEEGIAVITNILGGHAHVNYSAIPGVVYTSPEFAQVGRTEQDLLLDRTQYIKGHFPYNANSRSRCNLQTDGIVKFLAHSHNHKIIGIHILGPNAGEAIAEGVLGIHLGAKLEDIAHCCHAHPTMSEAIKEAALAALDKPIHL